MISLLYGGITHHYLNSHLPYCGRINNNGIGTIHNEYFIGLVGSDEIKIGGLIGKDSACGNIYGPVATFKLNTYFDIVLGGYNTNKDDFYKLGIEPPSFLGVTPVAGIDFKLPINKHLSLDTIISCGIITHAMRVNF